MSFIFNAQYEKQAFLLTFTIIALLPYFITINRQIFIHFLKVLENYNLFTFWPLKESAAAHSLFCFIFERSVSQCVQCVICVALNYIIS